MLHSLHLNPQFARVLEILPILYPDRHYYVLGRPTTNLSCSTTAADSKDLKLAYAFGWSVVRCPRKWAVFETWSLPPFRIAAAMFIALRLWWSPVDEEGKTSKDLIRTFVLILCFHFFMYYVLMFSTEMNFLTLITSFSWNHDLLKPVIANCFSRMSLISQREKHLFVAYIRHLLLLSMLNAVLLHISSATYYSSQCWMQIHSRFRFLFPRVD